MHLDALKTCYIEGLPKLPDRETAKALQYIGSSVVFQIGETSGVLCQFRSAAQIKVALEVLPAVQDKIKVTVSPQTKEWIEQTASSATAQSVTRMDGAALAAKIQAALDAALKTQTQAELPKTQLEPDGTLDSRFLPSELESLRRDVTEFRQETARLQTEQESLRLDLIEKFRKKIKLEEAEQGIDPDSDEEYARFDDARLAEPSPRLDWAYLKQKIELQARSLGEQREAWQQEERRRTERVEKAMAALRTHETFAGDLRELQLRCAQQRESDALAADDTSEEEPMEPATEPAAAEPAPIVIQLKEIDWSKITPEWLHSVFEPQLGKEVAELFGEADESLVAFILDLVAAQATPDQLKSELEGLLEEDAGRFADKITSLLKNI